MNSPKSIELQEESIPRIIAYDLSHTTVQGLMQQAAQTELKK